MLQSFVPFILSFFILILPLYHVQFALSELHRRTQDSHRLEDLRSLSCDLASRQKRLRRERRQLELLSTFFAHPAVREVDLSGGAEQQQVGRLSVGQISDVKGERMFRTLANYGNPSGAARRLLPLSGYGRSRADWGDKAATFGLAHGMIWTRASKEMHMKVF